MGVYKSHCAVHCCIQLEKENNSQSTKSLVTLIDLIIKMDKSTKNLIKTLEGSPDGVRKELPRLNFIQIQMILEHLLEENGQLKKKVRKLEDKDKSAFDSNFAKNVPHILESIFLSVDYDSYKTCHEVSKTWSDLLKSESFQRKAKYLFQDEITEDEMKLWNASKDGKPEMVQKLLSCGMLDVNNSLHTPLHIASEKGHKIVVKILLDKGADPNKTGRRMGLTPQLLAKINGHNGVANLLEREAQKKKIKEERKRLVAMV